MCLRARSCTHVRVCVHARPRGCTRGRPPAPPPSFTCPRVCARVSVGECGRERVGQADHVPPRVEDYGDVVPPLEAERPRREAAM